MALEAVIFDLDGVLVRTDEYHYRAWKQLADRLGVAFDRRKNQALRGVDRMGSLLRLLGPDHGYSQPQLEELAAEKNAHYVELIERITQADLLAGAESLLAELRGRGVKLAVASASKNARRVLQRLEIADRFDTIVTGHDFERGKPAPDIFLAAADRLCVSPAGCVVVEDAASGVAAARSAGMAVIGLGDPRELNAAHRVVRSLTDLSADSLAAVMRKAGPGAPPERSTP